MLYYILLIVNHLKLAWNFLLNNSLFPNIYDKQDDHQPGRADQQLGIVRYKSKLQQKQCYFDDADGEEEEGCAVCLRKIEEDDEMRELKCNHLFHKVCLDRWLGYSHSITCPICRTFLTPPKPIVGTAEVLTFNYYTFTSNHRQNWWLR
ncbi:E3 ubiquitin-protein ligase RHA2A-like [Durio zibethinus]|uniref:E3 ubiquitin-protein ligase RHA2A-like n=1 Tax=Durio zibethinus TaxID=66656 RepID=A0A6P5X988_DURZI|nr:E3 ubiquitin-protein ligase RHA2A-like [Durio zibethinus]